MVEDPGARLLDPDVVLPLEMQGRDEFLGPGLGKIPGTSPSLDFHFLVFQDAHGQFHNVLHALLFGRQDPHPEAGQEKHEKQKEEEAHRDEAMQHDLPGKASPASSVLE